MSPTSEPAPLRFTPTSNVLPHVGRHIILARESRRRRDEIVRTTLRIYLAYPGETSPGAFKGYEPLDVDRHAGLEIVRTGRKCPINRAIDAQIAAELCPTARPRRRM